MQSETRNNTIVATVFIAISLLTGSLIWAFVNTMERTGDRIEQTAEESKRDVRHATGNITASMKELVIIKQEEVAAFEKIFNNISHFQQERLDQAALTSNITSDRFQEFLNLTKVTDQHIIEGFENLSKTFTNIDRNIENSTSNSSGSSSSSS